VRGIRRAAPAQVTACRVVTQTPKNIEKVIAKVRKNQYGREMNCADLTGEFSTEGIDISAITIWRILRKAGFKKTKPTRKPRLIKKIREDRLK